jgi:hypothetical protein
VAEEDVRKEKQHTKKEVEEKVKKDAEKVKCEE